MVRNTFAVVVRRSLGTFVVSVTCAGAGVLLSACGIVFTSGNTSTTVSSTPVEWTPSNAMWPNDSGSVRFFSSEVAAVSFATSVIGMPHPVVQQMNSSDPTHSTVLISPQPGAPTTAVAVARLSGSKHWWVIGATTHNIEVLSPLPGQGVCGRFVTSGMSSSFEGAVNVALNLYGARSPIETKTAVGGGLGIRGRFHATLTFPTNEIAGGTVIYRVLSEKDSSVVEAAAVRVTLSNCASS